MNRLGYASLCWVVVSSFATSSFGDSWMAPRPQAVVSPGGERLVRIEPGTGDANPSRATYYRRDSATDSYQAYVKAVLANPVAPLDLLLNDEGVLVTLDNWFRVGYGPVVVIVDGEGDIVKSHKLEDLYTKERIDEIPHSVSSRWWRCGAAQPLISTDTVFVLDTFGGSFTFDLKDGSFQYDQGGGRC